MVYSTEDYAACNTTECREVAALRRPVVDGNITTCFRSPTKNNPLLMVVLDDYHPISLVRIMTSTISLTRVKMSVGNYSELQ